MVPKRFFRKSQDGYTLVEMIIVAALVMVGSAMAIPMSMRMVESAKGDSAMSMAASFLETARNRAVAERRNFMLSFPTSSSIRVERIEVPAGTLTLVDSLQLEGGEEFMWTEDLPDTPDDFGGEEGVNFTGAPPAMFTSDGSLIDSAGDITNATIYTGRPEAPETARAITIWGVTGMIRQWKWRGSEWQQ